MMCTKRPSKTTDPRTSRSSGPSAGGALTLSDDAPRQAGRPAQPGAMRRTPMSDATKTGDSFYANKWSTTFSSPPTAFATRHRGLCARPRSGRPAHLPVYGDIHGFPPAILNPPHPRLVSGNTVRVHANSAKRRRCATAGLRRPIARSIPVQRSGSRNKEASAKSAPSSTNTCAGCPVIGLRA